MKKTNWIYILISGIITGLLGTIGGAANTPKSIRRIGISVFLFLGINIIALLHGFWTPWLLLIGSIAGVFSIGYGVPGPDDAGSMLGRFWYKITKGNHFLTDVFCRGHIALMQTLPALSIAYARQRWGLYFIVAGLMIANDILWGAIVEREGEFEFLGIKLSWEEFYRYFGTGIGYTALTFL